MMGEPQPPPQPPHPCGRMSTTCAEAGVEVRSTNAVRNAIAPGRNHRLYMVGPLVGLMFGRGSAGRPAHPPPCHYAPRVAGSARGQVEFPRIAHLDKGPAAGSNPPCGTDRWPGKATEL